MTSTFHVLHILVKEKYEAEDILKKLETGNDFSELARKYSTCSSAKLGGDLGEIKSGRADADFEEAALSLKCGEITRVPVRTRFGYHIIKRLK
jgi:parvulin-like peptidyl-prolyl isomerase